MGNQNQKSIDLVYVLGKGSPWENNEIRFSLRSVEKNLKGIRKIWIVGEKPEFIRNINHIPFPDELANNADGNIIRKVLRVCQEETLTDNFLFINDDHLILKPVMAIDIPPYHKGDLRTFNKEFFEANFWRGRLWRTMIILLAKGYPALHFDCHTPMVMNKARFPEVISNFDFEKQIGYTMKSLYGNLVYPDAAQINGEKEVLFRPYILNDIIEKVKDKTFMAFNDEGLKIPLKTWLYLNFPDQSKYEKPSTDPFFEIMKWIVSEERDFTSGCQLYDKYGKSKKVKRYLSKDESHARYEKLEYKIRELLNYY
jgi:hypothetical protein